MIIAIGNDHAGVALKNAIIDHCVAFSFQMFDNCVF